MSIQQTPGIKLPELSAAKRALLEARLKPQARVSTLVRRAHTGDVPLSFAQERLYFLDRLQPGNPAYNVAFALRLPGAVDAALLERALGEVVRRHEALRTTFHERGGVPVQVVEPFTGFVLPVEDLSGLDEAAREAEVARRAGESARHPFDLARGPLLRVTLLRLGAEDHVLLMCMHHVVSDGWSMPVLRREVQALYAAFADGRPSPLSELPVQYADYAVWQREEARGGRLERQLAYWKGQLAGAPELLELPTDHPRPAAPSGRGGTVPVAIPAGTLAGLRALAQREGATLFMVVLGAFQALLAKYAGTTDVVVGTPIAGRTHQEMEGLIGFFVNTLALRTDLSGDPRFAEALRRVRGTMLAAYENQEVPFEKLVAELQPERSMSHSPLFQVMFMLESADAAGASPGGSPGAGAEALATRRGTAKFDLTLGLAATSDGLRGDLEYSTDLFERATAERLAGHLARVLQQVAADADVRLSALSLMDTAERARVVDAWNRTDTDDGTDATVHERFAAQAARTPDALALVAGDESLSYAELDGRANALAHRLAALGAGPDVRVGLCLERGVEMAVAVLAVLKAGGAYVPLDPGYPADRIAYMLADSGAAVLVTQQRLRDRVPAGGVAVLVLDAEDGADGADAKDGGAGARADAPASGAGPRNLAYVIYTSGSTGRPKGVAVEHAQAGRYLDWATRTYPWRSSAVHSSLSFDLTVTSLFVPLLCGGSVELVPEEGAVEALADRLRRGGGFGLLKLTPAHLRVLGEHLGGRPAAGGGAECLVVGGEPLLGEALEFWKRQYPDTIIVNEYGPTETVVGCCIHAQPLRDTGPGQMPIGRPVPNTRLYVLDASGQPVPIGIPGELFVGGAQVTRGYLGRPALTAERFVPDPFASAAGARMYTTGDRVRWRSDGTLEYLGRLDEQVKIRGFRVELGEIESVLRRAPGVADCAVVAREDVPGDRRLVAYVAGDADGEALRAELRRALPEHMVPSAIVPVDHLPLTPNGKLDRRRLPAPEYASGERYVAPRSPVEQVLAEVWGEVLRRDRVGVRDSFFALGGHSLLAMRIVSRVREVFRAELPLRALFEGPTVEEMAVRLEEIRRAGAAALPPVVPVDRTGPLPLSFAQERMWFLHRLQPESAFYNTPAILRLEGGVDEPALERALGEVIRRHEALRTVFPEVDGAPVQRILPFAGFTLPVEDLSSLNDEEREAEVRRRVDAEAVRPFVLSTGPLFRPALLRLGDEDHVLLLGMHHILSDQWSMGVLFRELSTLYQAFRAGAESPLAPLPVQYADYAAWQREQMRGEALERHLAWWTARLAGAPALLELPTDHPRPAVQTYRGATELMDVPAELLERLRALGRGEGATLYMVAMGAFQSLLSKYSGSEDVVVGSPVSGRSRREIEELIGLFLNTLVLRTELGGDPSFREVLGRVREVTLGAYEHQEVPFERLVEALQPGRSLSHSPIFQVMFVLQDTDGSAGADSAADPANPDSAAGAGDVRLRGVGTESGTSKFDLTLSVAPHAGGLGTAIEYNTDLFAPATIRRMLAHFHRVLEQVAADADVRLSALELMDGAERRQVVAGWNATEAEYPAIPVHALFEAQADRTPDAPAVVTAAGETLRFADVEARANRLANHLDGLGVGPDDRVALCLERGPEMMVALLGILKAGAAYVPLDPAYPAERLAYMLEDSDARVLLTETRLADRLPPSAAVVVRVDEDAGAIARASADRPRVAVDADHLAYVIYTSGSTGRPKGVALHHRPLANLLAWQAGDWRAGARAVTLQFATVSFDASFHEVFSAWMAGGSVVLIDEALRYDPAGLLDVMERAGVERVFMPAVALQQLAEVADARGLVPSRLREVQTAGEQLRVTEPMRRWLAALGAPLYNHYGPSETHVVTSLALEGDPSAWPLLPGIGAPIANTQCYVADARLRPLPIGLPGELYLGGDNVARGYLGRPALTAERFVPDPFASRPGVRMYRTGDRARWLADGTIEFLGRTDEQVKIRGFRIEPGEVEAVLAAHPQVREAVAVVREDAPGDRRLVAYVVAADGASPMPTELRAHLKGRLPEYMLPSAVVVLDSIPLTPSGKVARRALPAPDGAAAGTEYVAPRTETEEILAGIYADVLRVERVGVAESFFEMGGHSLLATRVVSRIRDVLGVELPLRALFEHPSVAEVALAVEALRRADAPVLPPVVPVARTAPPPLSFAQERLWFLDRLQPGGTAYVIPAALRLGGALDVDALRRALGEVVRRHETLRTTFAEVGGAPVQVIAPFAGFDLPVEDLSGLVDGEREAAAARRAREDASRPFDLEAGPLFRASLLRLADDDHLLLASMHHVVSDGWSMDVLHREMSALYAAFRAGGEASLPELPVQYADYAVWQRTHLAGEALEGQLAYWKRQLAGAPELLELPADHPRPAAPSFRGGGVPVEVPAAVLDRLQAVGRGEGATLFMVLLGAFQLLLARYSGTADVVVGSPIAGRTRREVEGLIGFFVNTLVLRTELDGDPPFREVLRRVRQTTLGAYEHQDVPFEKLVAELQPERSLSHAPLFQVTFTLNRADDAEASAAADAQGLRVAQADAGLATAKFDLMLGLETTAQGLRGGLTYATDLFERATVERMAGHLARVLEQVAADADVRLSRLELMAPAERAALVDGWRRADASVPAEGSIHARVAAQARRTPAAAAVVCGERSLAYGELEARAEHIARRLVRLGVGPEVRVGLCLDRSVETVVAILGVLKAGGAYVPVDPAYPEDRIEYLLADSGVALVITQDTTRDAVPASATARVLTLDSLLAEDRADDGKDDALDSTPWREPAPENAAYVIYTSGSTGRPKGVVVTHANVLRLFSSTDAWFGFGAEDVWTLFHSYAFDFSVWEIWGALLYGGRLVVVPYHTSRDPAAFRELLARERVTVLNQTPSAFRQLVRADEGAQGELALRWVVFGGEALEPRALKPWFQRRGDRRPTLVNMYGITETTVHVTYRPVTGEDAESPAGSRVGEPIPDLGVYLLDGRMEPVPAGVPGEMFVGGGGVARGYLGRPALTAQRFVPDPYAGIAGARMYRSGDRARLRSGGDVEYLGRADQQVKIRGFRIEPGEVEAALLAHPGVREALVLAREDEPGVRRLVAYVVADAVGASGDDTADAADADGGMDVAALRLALAARLPDYMVPAAFVRLDALPLTPHGKVDRRALPAPDGTQVAAEAYVAPAGPVETALAAVWAETLRVERVGARDNFFALGGDSMRAIQLLALARARGIPFSLQDLFRHQTVAELAAQIQPEESAENSAVEAASVPFALLDAEDRARVPEGVEDAYPMTRMQLGMLYHTERAPGQAVYHNVQAYHVSGRFDPARMRSALGTLARRHPILRTSFDLAGFSEPMQLVHRHVEIPLVVDSLAGLDADAQDAAMDAWLQAERRRPFDWRTAPLIRFHVHELGADALGEDAFQFGFAEHHAILDGWSVAALQTELSRLYFDASAALDEPAPAPVVRDFAALECEVLASADARAFWAEVLDDAVPVLPASLGLARGAGNRSRGGALPADVAGRLAELARGAGLPLKSVFLAAHLRVLALAGGVADVTTGVVVNGRPEGADAERALGLFLNTVPFRIQLNGGSWMDLVRAAFQVERRMLPFRRFPTAELQRMRGGEPAFAALFNFIHFHVMDGMSAGGASVGAARSAGGTDFPFGVTFEVTPGGVQLYMEYDTARYTEGEADRLVRWYLDVLRRMAADPGARYDTSLASADGADDVDWIDAADDVDRIDGVAVDGVAAVAESASSASVLDGADADADAETLHGLFTAHAARTPDAPALACGGRTLTYGDVDGQAGRLARVLRGRGVGAEVRVAVCCARSPEMVVGMLGVLRAGGVCVPLDPAYPAERLALILADAGVRLVVTDAATADVIGAFGVDALVLDGAGEGEEKDGSALPEIAVHPRSAAYVIYTSGSTGTPKGVVVEHGAAAAHVAAFARTLALSPADRVLHFAPAGFDVSIEQMFLPLASGAALVLRQGEPWSPAEWVERTAALGITVANLAPAYWTEVVAASGGGELPALRVMLVGADAMPSAGVRAWRTAVRTPARLMNAYGPTEAVVTATVHDVPGDGEAGGYAGAVVPIGGALPGRAAYVLDAFGTPAPVGVPGELCLGGGLLARGYGGRPALTAERFVPDPFSATPGARMYRTGDRARRLAGGALEFLGRLDAQVKVRGFRIEPGEVEAALAQHPAVRDAAVLARGDAGETLRLVAYVAAPGGDAPSAAELRAHLRARLPEHMGPSAFVVLDALPLTPHGKLDRRALPAPEGERGADAYVAPRDGLELRLARLWAELLGADAVGVRDDFFALGGHSLVALRLLASVERMTGRRVPMATLLAGPTVERLAAVLRSEDSGAASGPLVPIQPAGNAPPLFLVHAAGGNVVSYAALARHLGPDQPLYGLQSRGLEGGEPLHARIEDMAVDYLAELRAVQPAGPYRLGGWSMGGLVAFEMARMLHAAGEDVELLALVDTPAPGGRVSAVGEDDELELLAGFMLHLGLAPAQITLAAAEVAALPPADRLPRAWEAARAADLVPAELPLSRFQGLWAVYRANAAAAAAYRPAPAQASLLLVTAQDRPAPASREEAGWAALTTGTVRTAAAPGDHFTLVREPHAGALAALLADALASSTDAAPAAART